MTHKTGYLYQDLGGMDRPLVESWHRTLAGATKAKDKNNGRGYVYRIVSDDETEKLSV